MTEETAILLVEDNPNDIELTLHAFDKYWLANNITVVRDGAEALDYLFRRGEFAERGAESNPKLILLDIKMPKIDGLEVLSKIKSDPATRLIPVVALSSSRDEQDVATAYALGANSYISKPVDFDSFIEIVGQLGLYWLVINAPPNLSL